ncbi:MAG: hypothetical protein KQJ78_13105 [Deltaproteobacteria bacterium]|nr:hypothetical protein [Deltaproteobacteria bacterium]
MNEKFYKKLQLQTLLEEYRVLSDEIIKRVEFQQRVLNYELIAAGAILSVLVQIALAKGLSIKAYEAIKFFLVISPYVFLFFSWTISRHDVMIISIASYKEHFLKPLIRSITKCPSLFSYEEFMQNIRRDRKEKYGTLAKLEQGVILPILMNFCIMLIYFAGFGIDEYHAIIKPDPLAIIRLFFVITNLFLFVNTTRMSYSIPTHYLNITKPYYEVK